MKKTNKKTTVKKKTTAKKKTATKKKITVKKKTTTKKKTTANKETTKKTVKAKQKYVCRVCGTEVIMTSCGTEFRKIICCKKAMTKKK